MGKHKEEFADVRMKVDYYHSLDEEIKSNMELRKIHVEGWEEEYKNNPEWIEQSKKSPYEEWKKLKKIEFEIRNNNK